MSYPTARRTVIAVTAALLIAPAVAACGTGESAVARNIVSPGDGLVTLIGGMRVQNILVVAPPSGSKTAVLSVTLYNSQGQPDQLTGVTFPNGATARLSGAQQIPPGTSLRIGGPDAPAHVYVDNFTTPAGAYVPLTLRFQNAGDVSMQPPVMTPDDYYSSFVAPSTGTGASTPAATSVPTGASAVPATPTSTPSPT